MEFVLGKVSRFFASLRMTGSEGFAMKLYDRNLFMTFTIVNVVYSEIQKSVDSRREEIASR